MVKGYKKKLAVMVMVLMVLPLTGCDKQIAKQKKEIKALKETIVKKDAQIAQLNKDIEGLGITELKKDTSLREVEGSKVPKFETIDGKIVFPTKLEMPNATEAVNHSYIQVGDKFRFSPSNNWQLRMQGSTLEVSHPLKIWGNIKAINMPEEVAQEPLKNMLQAFFKKFPATTISYREVFIDGRNAGMIAKAPLTVDEKPFVVNVGVIQKGEYALLVLMAYEDNQTGAQQEMLDLLLSSGLYGDYKITLE